MTRAVVFDLFETLVDYDEQKSLDFSAEAAALLGRDPEDHKVWRAGARLATPGCASTWLRSG